MPEDDVGGEAVQSAVRWPLVLGVEAGNSFVYQSAYSLVGEYLLADPEGEWSRWYPLADFGPLSVILRYRHETRKPATRVSRTRDGLSASRAVR